MVAKALGLSNSAKAVCLEVIGYLEREPFAHSNFYFPEWVGSLIQKADAKVGLPILRIVEQKISQRVRARRAECAADTGKYPHSKISRHQAEDAHAGSGPDLFRRHGSAGRGRCDKVSSRAIQLHYRACHAARVKPTLANPSPLVEVTVEAAHAIAMPSPAWIRRCRQTLEQAPICRCLVQGVVEKLLATQITFPIDHTTQNCEFLRGWGACYRQVSG